MSRPRPTPVERSRPLRSARITARVSLPFQYLLQLPPGYRATTGKRWPLLVFLHGKGERGDDLALVQRHGPPRLVAEGQRFPFILIAPQCPDDRWWTGPEVNAFVAAVTRRYRVDPARVYLTGLSMGGFGTWAAAQHERTRYAAILPICGGGEPRIADELRDLPVWAFHGAKDRVIVPRRSREMIAAITAGGGQPRLTIYPRAEHDSWTATYANPEVYTWLLSHRRRAPRRRARSQ